jgi:hypothetical protein
MMEGRTAIAGLRRSWELTRQRRGTLFVALLVLGVLGAVVAAVVGVPFALFADPYVTAVGSVLATAITGSWSIILAAVAYQLFASQPRAWKVPRMPPSPYGGPAAGPPPAG